MTKAEFKTKIENTLERRLSITDDTERDAFFTAMSEILETTADCIEENEPHASVPIQAYRRVANDVYSYEDFIDSNGSEEEEG